MLAIALLSSETMTRKTAPPVPPLAMLPIMLPRPTPEAPDVASTPSACNMQQSEAERSRRASR